MNSSNNNQDDNSSQPIVQKLSIFDRIKTPSELRITDKGKMKSLVRNIKGLEKYVDALISEKGPWKAIKNSDVPLGTSGFVDTNTYCTDPEGKPRFIYNDSIPRGSNRSLIFGIINDVENLVPGSLFTSGSNAECKEATLLVTKADGSQCFQKEYVGINDLIDIDPCMFDNGEIPNDTLKSLQEVGSVANNGKCTSKRFVKKLCGVKPTKDCVPLCPDPNTIEDDKANSNNDNDDKEGFKNRYRKNKQIQNLFVFIFQLFILYLIYKIIQKKI